MKIFKNQVEILKDLSGTGKERPWSEKKMANEYLAIAYDEVDINKARRLRDCATVLTFSVSEDNKKRLTQANFCRIRLCPMCSWRRGLKIFGHTMAIMEEMKKEKEWSYIFITFTIKNCVADELNSQIDKLMVSWNRLMGYTKIKKAIKGWYRGLEITHNIANNSKDYDTFHPHFHCVFAVNKSYFTEKTQYISQKEWTSYFQKAMKIDYTPIVDVRKVNGDTAKAVAEVAKYAVKDSDYIIADDWELTISTVRLLDTALANRRLVAYGGKFKELHKKLNLDDEENGDLILNGIDSKEKEENISEVTYSWNIGYSQYMKH